MWVVFDLDGTLSDPEHRVHFLEGKKNGEMDWDAFFLASKFDTPIKEIIVVAASLSQCGHRVDIWTGRSEGRVGEVRESTLEWLRNYGLGGTFREMKMRAYGDNRGDYTLKEEWLKGAMIGGGKPDLVFEDRQRVVDMWRSHGIQCVQVAEGDF